jgi:predicted ATPase
MARIEGIRIQNYRTLKDVSLGLTFENRDDEPLPGLMTIIGPNGSGKSSLMDALGFLGDCLRLGVEDACDRSHRGGFERIRTRGQYGPIQFEIYYRQDPKSRPISYSLHIDAVNNRPYVAYERLRQRRKGQKHGWPYSFLELARGQGYAWAGQPTEKQEGNERIEVKLEDRQRLGITTLGNLANHPRIVAFREFLEGWYLSYFVPEQARSMPMAGAQMRIRISVFTLIRAKASSRGIRIVGLTRSLEGCLTSFLQPSKAMVASLMIVVWLCWWMRMICSVKR